MYKVVNGISYDTRTAKRIAFYEFSSIGYYEWVYKVLFQTPFGHYFTYETGGCGTEYAVRVGNKMVGAHYHIFPATADEARIFLFCYNPKLALELFPDIYK